MPTRRPNGRFDREEGLNINISIFTILKYLIALAAIFPGYKLIEKTEILNIYDTSCPAWNECSLCLSHWKIQSEVQLENSIK